MKRTSAFPGGSRKRVTKAGENIRANTATQEDFVVINEWRAAHRPVINSFQAILRGRTRDSDIIVAQRHKRRRTIFDKLNRQPKMQLGRMDDVAGCRLIFPDVVSLHQFRQDFHKSRFKHKLQNEGDKYDYIAHPKDSGYRGIHDVYSYDVRSTSGKHLKGLLIELQYRTKFQHAWATANELIGNLTENQPKFERGDPRYQRIMRLASEIIARAFESVPSSLPGTSNKEVVNAFASLDKEIRLMDMFGNLNSAKHVFLKNKNFILVFREDGKGVHIHPYRYATNALQALFEFESDDYGSNIVLVSADNPEDVRESFKNYFSDATDFIGLVDDGCKRLMQEQVITLDQLKQSIC